MHCFKCWFSHPLQIILLHLLHFSVDDRLRLSNQRLAAKGLNRDPRWTSVDLVPGGPVFQSGSLTLSWRTIRLPGKSNRFSPSYMFAHPHSRGAATACYFLGFCRSAYRVITYRCAALLRQSVHMDGAGGRDFVGRPGCVRIVLMRIGSLIKQLWFIV